VHPRGWIGTHCCCVALAAVQRFEAAGSMRTPVTPHRTPQMPETDQCCEGSPSALIPPKNWVLELQSPSRWGQDRCSNPTGSARFGPRSGLGGDGRYFFPAKGQAVNIANLFEKGGAGGPHSLMSGVIPNAVLSSADTTYAAGEDDAFYRQNHLLDSMTHVTIHGSVQWASSRCRP